MSMCVSSGLEIYVRNKLDEVLCFSEKYVDLFLVF